MRGRLLSAAVGAAVMIAALGGTAMARGPQGPTAADLVDKLGRANVARHAATGQVRFVRGTDARPAATSAELGDPRTAKAAALRFMERYGSAFGIRDAARDLRVSRTMPDGTGRTFVRYQQLHRGVPVLGGELTVQVGAQRDVISANGEASPDLGVDVQPTVTAAGAATTAKAATAKRYDMRARDLSATAPKLWVYDPALMGGRAALSSPRLVWRMDVTGRGADFRELVLVDAERDVVALRFDQIAHARNRVTCDANGTANEYPCTVGVAERTETGGPSGIADVDNAHVFAGHTYDFFFNRFGRDSLDGAGMTLFSTVRYCPSPFQCPFQNAFWDGSQMVYGAGFASADDVVGHELSHGVTDFTSSLFYYYQSGAINEALSDIFGEYMDLTNGAGTDTGPTRWKMGEDLPIGALRDMQDPTFFGDPDRMQSSLYFADDGEQDAGGVHFNSGVANKAAYLMADGDSFNGQTVTGLGIDKAAAIWYRVETQYLGSASDYADLGSSLNQACTDLVGQQVRDSTGAVTGTILAADCTEVSQAVLATEMALQPTAPRTAATHAPVCDSGSPANVFFDDLENTASGNWSTAGLDTSPNIWYYPQTSHPYAGWDPTYATSGDTNFWGDDIGSVTDSVVQMTSGVTIPAGGFLHFAHAFGFEDGSQYGASNNVGYDGGILERKVGTGAWVAIPDSMFTHNSYNGTVQTTFGNPLAGMDAFINESHGYISSRVDLSSLSGQSVRFRFRIGTDTSGADYGWFVDDVRIYSCTTTTTHQPDGRIRLGTSGAFVGDNVYNTTAVGQKKSGSAPRGSTITFEISAQNDATVADSLTLLGGGSSADYTVKYLDGAVDVTAAVVAGTYTTPSLAPGSAHLITVKVKVKSSAPAGSKVARKVTISSVGDPSAKDAVKFVGKRA